MAPLNHLDKAQVKSLIIVPSITACVSLFASITLIVSIYRSHQRLSSVYRRLVFGLSVFDILQSVTHFVSSLPMPAGTIWGAIGNDVTCDLQGIFSTIGPCGAILYSFSLTVYFLLVCKFNMSEAKIKKNVEPFLHAVPIVYSLAVSASIYATNNYNPMGMLCWIAPEPINCEDDPEVECQSSGNLVVLRLIAGLPVFGVFIGNCTILTVIWWNYCSQVRKNQTYYSNSLAQTTTIPQQQSDEEGQTEESERSCSCSLFCPTKKCPTNIIRSNSQTNTPRTSVLTDYLSQRRSYTATRNLKEISSRASAYVIGFILTYVFSIINFLTEISGSDPSPFTIILLAKFFFPLQGLFNVLVYTYPHVISYRRNHPDCNWFRAFWNVIKSGGDSDQPRSGRVSRRRSSLRHMQRVLEQSELRGTSRFGGNMNSG